MAKRSKRGEEMEPEKTQGQKAEVPEKTHEHTAGLHETAHGHSTQGGGLLTGRLALGLLVALSLGFGVVMIKKYRDLEAKVRAGIAPTELVAPVRDAETENALNELGKKLGAIESELDGMEAVLKKLGVRMEKPTKPHIHH